MLLAEHIETGGWETAIRGMRNPMNSWEKSDSRFAPKLEIGKNDLDLMIRLVSAGTDHRKFMRMIIVSMDITAPLYWWKEMDTYKVGTVADSCSTMHKIHAKEFVLDDFSHEHLTGTSEGVLRDIIDILNMYRNMFLLEKDQGAKKEYWWQMIQMLPSSYNQKRTWTANYEVLRNIYHARKNHKLDEWHTLCHAIEELPYFALLIKD